MTLADRICVLRKGKVQQFAPPRTIYEAPATSFVATFIGAPKMNLLDCRSEGGVLACGPFKLPAPADKRLPDRVLVGVRPEDVKLVDASEEGATKLEVAVAEPLGAETSFVLRAPGDVELRARVPGFDARGKGAVVHVSLARAGLHFFEADEDGKRLA